MRGRAIAEMFIFSPRKATIQAVVVVPTLLPYMTQIDSPRVTSPAFTNPMMATVTAPEDCTTEVMRKPESSPLSLVLVHLASIDRNNDPAASFKPLDISRIPSRIRPTPPMIWINRSIFPLSEAERFSLP
jgi:hypothetical protein